MGAATALPVRDVHVEPGATATAKMLVRNTGQVVDQFTIDVVGACAAFTSVEPKVVNLLPGADVEVTITFAPARSPEVPAGVIPFGIRVLSREDPPGSTVAEGSVEVAPFDDVQVEIVPRQSKGRRRGKHQVAIDNNGNMPSTVVVTVADEEEALDFRLDHDRATIEPGAAAFIRLAAVPEKRFLKGADRQHPFVVTVTPHNSAPVATRGTMTQRQLLPQWLLPVIAVLAALVIAAIVLWETLFKPKINSVAKDAASKAVKSANSSEASKVDAAQSQAAAAQSQAAAANSKANAAVKKVGASTSPAKSTSGSGGSGGVGPDNTNIGTGNAVSFNVPADATPTPGDTSTFTITDGRLVDANHLLVITAIVIQNPNGDNGTLKIQRGSSETLLTEGLANFRDLDHHFDDEPLIFTNAKPLELAVNCQTTTATQCSPSVLFTGRIVKKPST